MARSWGRIRHIAALPKEHFKFFMAALFHEGR